MRFIGTKTHGYLDYLVGILLIASPWIFDFKNDGAQTYIPIILGVAAIVYSLLTNYELGLSRTLSMRTHLALDFMSGLFLAVSPWLFGFADNVYLPHLILGIAEIGAALFTKQHSSTENSNNRAHQGRHATAH